MYGSRGEGVNRGAGRREGRDARGGQHTHRGLLALGLVGLAILAVWLWVTVPLAAGERSLFFRDVLDNHFALKSFGAAALARGEIPAVNPTLGLGQPFRGNPSALAFYPGNALYLLLPFWSAFNLHFALHWLLALVAMALLARRLGMAPAPALLAGLTYAGGGWFLSTLSFYNVIGVAAWWPLAMAGAVAGSARSDVDRAEPTRGRWSGQWSGQWRGQSRGLALGGAACGMALLAGEPMTAALGMLPLAVLAVGRHGPFRGLATSAAIGALGLAVAAPQVVATGRILGSSLRGSAGVANLATHFSLPPLRLAELVLPLPFGWPLDLGPHGWWLGRTAPDIGFFLSLYAGIIALWLALRGARRRAAWAAVAIAGVAGAILLAAAPDLLRQATGGLFRYPEKLLFWYALTLPLLAGEGLQAALAPAWAPGPALPAAPPGRGERAADAPPSVAPPAFAPQPRPWGAALAGGLLLVAAVVVALAWPRFADGTAIPQVVAAQSAHLMAYLALGGMLLLAGAAALRRRAGTVLVALQLVALLQLFPLVRTLGTEPLSRPAEWNRRLGVAALGEGTAVFNTRIPNPAWDPPPDRVAEAGSRAANDLRNARHLYPAPGIAFGLTYPLAPNIEGLAPAFHTFAAVEAQRSPWRQRLAWLRTFGVEALVTYRPPGVPGLELIDRQASDDGSVYLYTVDGSAPDAWWPQAVEAAGGPRQAFARVSRQADPVATVVTSREMIHDPEGAVRLVAEGADRLELEVSSRGGGLAVMRRAYQPIYEARTADGERLETLPTNLALLGVEVPAGEHRVILEIDDGPETMAGVASLLALLAIAGLVWAGRPAPPGPTAKPTTTNAGSATGAATEPSTDSTTDPAATRR